MPKPELYPVKKLLRLDHDTVEAVEAFRAKEADEPSYSEAIRRILRDWLISHGHLEKDANHN